MNKTDLIKKICDKTGSSKAEVPRILNQTFEIIKESAKEERKSKWFLKDVVLKNEDEIAARNLKFHLNFIFDLTTYNPKKYGQNIADMLDQKAPFTNKPKTIAQWNQWIDNFRDISGFYKVLGRLWNSNENGLNSSISPQAENQGNAVYNMSDDLKRWGELLKN